MIPPPPSRKRSAPINQTPQPSGALMSRPRLPVLKRMGSAIGLTPSSVIGTEKQSPTRYADELFSATAPPTESQSQRYQPERSPSRLPPTARVKEPFKVPSEIEKFLTTTDASVLGAQPSPSDSAFFTEERRPSDPSTPSPNDVPPVENPRKRLQRQRSRSLHELEEAYRATPTFAAPPPSATAREDQQRNRLQRMHSQSFRSLADAVAQPVVAPRGSVGSISAAQTRILQRMSTFVADASGQVSSKLSPTHYADELFRRRSKDPNSGAD